MMMHLDWYGQCLLNHTYRSYYNMPHVILLYIIFSHMRIISPAYVVVGVAVEWNKAISTCDTWQQTVHLAADHGAITHGIAGRHHQDKSLPSWVSLAWHRSDLWKCWRGVEGSRCHGLCACSPALCTHLPMVLALTECLMEGITARRISTIIIRYSDKDLLAYVICVAKCEAHSHVSECQTYPSSFIPVVDSFWVQQFL